MSQGMTETTMYAVLRHGTALQIRSTILVCDSIQLLCDQCFGEGLPEGL